MSWICPHCGTTATLRNDNVNIGGIPVLIDTAKDDEGISLAWRAIKCPSKTCGKFFLEVKARFGVAGRYDHGARTGKMTPDSSRPVGIGDVCFEPRVGVPLSNYLPRVVSSDYDEAHLIRDLSPKAAATLCRRALQGMIRDFHGVSKATLHEELQAIKGSCDPALFDAMMGLKGIGNIGAHPEKDINLIVDVEEGEVDILLELLRILDKEWYVARASRHASLAAVKALAATKVAAKSANAMASPVPPPSP